MGYANEIKLFKVIFFGNWIGMETKRIKISSNIWSSLMKAFPLLGIDLSRKLLMGLKLGWGRTLGWEEMSALGFLKTLPSN